MKINDQVYLVGGGDYGFNISNRLDCNTYVIDTGDELWLIDAGFDGADRILENIRADGLDATEISRIFVTHYHADHAGGLATMRERLGSDLEVAVSELAAPAIRQADENTTGLAWAKSFGFYPKEFVWRPCEIDRELKDGKSISAGDATLLPILTNGHCNGHMSFHVTVGERSYLFSGDHVFWGGKIILQNVADSNVQEYARSMTRLLDYDFSGLMPGHLSFSLEDGKRHVRAAAEQFLKIGLPANLL